MAPGKVGEGCSLLRMLKGGLSWAGLSSLARPTRIQPRCHLPLQIHSFYMYFKRDGVCLPEWAVQCPIQVFPTEWGPNSKALL